MLTQLKYDFNDAEENRQRLENLIQTYTEIKNNLEDSFVSASNSWSGNAAGKFRTKCDDEMETTENILCKLNSILTALETRTDEMRTRSMQMSGLAGL